MTTGAARPQAASLNDCHSGGRGSPSALAPQPWRRASQSVGTISAAPASSPGTMPPMKSAGTETPGTMTA